MSFAFFIPVREFCLESGQIQDIAVHTSEINCKVKGQSQDHDSKSLYFELWGLNSCGHISQCTGGGSVEDVTAVQVIQDLQIKIAVYVVSEQSKQMLNTIISSDFHYKLNWTVTY